MSLLGVIACSMWGGAAAYFFFEAWMAFIGLVASAIGLIRRKRAFGQLARAAHERFLRLVLFGVSLSLLFVMFWTKWGLGRTPSETLAFAVMATVVMLVMLPRIRPRIDAIWEETNEPE